MIFHEFWLQKVSYSVLRSTHFMQLFYFSTPRKRQEISGFLTFAGGIEI